MGVKEFFSNYGEKVAGYDVRVINEREARAAAGILFALGMIAIFNSIALSHGIIARIYIAFFTLDFLIRVINPRYSPSLMFGRFFVRNQKPEYVGAAQKRFAWLIGLILALYMFDTVTVVFEPNPMKVVICITCLVLLFLESAFSYCLGCEVYSWFNKKVSNCPGGVCELQIKEPVQKFTPIQAFIAIITAALLIGGTYYYLAHMRSSTMFGQRVRELFLSDKELKAIKEKEYQKQLEEFENDDDF